MTQEEEEDLARIGKLHREKEIVKEVSRLNARPRRRPRYL